MGAAHVVRSAPSLMRLLSSVMVGSQTTDAPLVDKGIRGEWECCACGVCRYAAGKQEYAAQKVCLRIFPGLRRWGLRRPNIIKTHT